MRKLACVFCLLASLGVMRGVAEEPDDSQIIDRILQARGEILKSMSDTSTPVVFITAWDFDGTILKGDCTEGFKAGNRTVYRGLAQMAIENGFSQLYPSAGGFDKFWMDYTNMDAHVGHWLAYPFVPQMLRGAKADDVLHLSQSYFDGTLSNYLMASSVKIIRGLERGGVESHIISASPDLFVKGASHCLGVPSDHLHGIEVRTRDGRLTEEVVYPITWNTGKLERLQQMVAAIEHQSGGRKVFVLGGFGDSYDTDGPFLKFIATQSLPAGKAISVFYGDPAAPREYQGVFYHAQHAATVSDKAP